MCGIAAYISAAQIDSPLSDAAVRRMLTRMQSRGPDGEGEWREPGVVLGHRRLAVIDLELRAAQPMHSRCGRYVICFNGEIYNFRSLRREIEAAGSTLTTESDTEVLLELFAAHGESMLSKLEGMFAFVIWDRMTRRAFAARDPYGIKPLYIAATRDGLLVASQVKALIATGLLSRGPCIWGRAGFWMLGSVPEPYTWYRDIRALPAGQYIWIESGQVVEQRQWADVGSVWREAATEHGLAGDNVDELVHKALHRSIQRHLVADVPVGLFLSGGIDSGSLAGLMVDHASGPIVGVTLAYDEFRGRREDEVPAATAIAGHYGIDHHIRRVGREEFIADWPNILRAMDQPSIDGINTWYASRAAAELGLKVVISGVGGDELLQGYRAFWELPRLVHARTVMRSYRRLIRVAQMAAEWRARKSNNGRWRHLVNWSESISGAWWLRRSLFCPEDLSALMGSDAAEIVLKELNITGIVERMSGPLATNPRLAIGQIESSTYLRNQLLRDSDWASMSQGVELRTPLVDMALLRIVAPLLPTLSRGRGKALLASSPTRSLPVEVTRRKKTGFGIPINSWLSGSAGHGVISNSRDWARSVVQAYEAAAE